MWVNTCFELCISRVPLEVCKFKVIDSTHTRANPRPTHQRQHIHKYHPQQ